MKYHILILSFLALVSCGGPKESKLITPVNFSEVTIKDEFWSPKLKVHKDTTIKVCIDQIENKTARMKNFEYAATRQGTHQGYYFDDSDVYKALEGLAYSLRNNPDSLLEAKCDEWIDKIAAAQEADGYLNTFYTLTGEPRWNDMSKHEMYCAGHLIEAAVAYYDVTGKRKLLDVSCRMANHMMTVFGPGKRDWVPGHEEIELALVKLYRATGNKHYLKFAKWLLEERGHGHYSNDVASGVMDGDRSGEYCQDNVPVGKITDICGHAVRAMYLYCGMSDVAAYDKDTSYINSLNRVWTDVVDRNMYVTGGIGQTATNEGFTNDYSLPNKDAYCETCASVGMVLWNSRMNQMSGQAKYVDVLEKCLYNGALSGISLDGTHFFYQNPLESDGKHHRMEWFGCACCPSQICRFLPSIGNYIYGENQDTLYVNLFIGNKSKYMSIKTEYPWNGKIAMRLEKEGAKKEVIKIRIPDWCDSYTSRLTNNRLLDCDRDESGYLVMKAEWKEGDIIVLSLDMPVKMVEADSLVMEDRGKRAVQMGPVVYCLEEVDNKNISNALLTSETKFDVKFNPDLLGGVNVIKSSSGLKFIPYYAWDNRKAGKMKVWVDYKQLPKRVVKTEKKKKTSKIIYY